MPTIIDSLLVEVGLDATGFKKGQKEVELSQKKVKEETERTAKDMEARGKQAGGFFKDLQEGAGSFLGMMATAYSGAKIAGMTKDIINNAESMGFLAKNLNMSTQRLDAWGMAAEKNGGSAESMVTQLQAAQQASAAYRRGGEWEGMGAFVGYGGNLDEVRKGGEEYLAEMSRILKPWFAPGKDRTEGMDMAKRMGINPGALNLLMQGKEETLAAVKAQEKYASVNAEFSASSHELVNNFRDIGYALKGISTALIEGVNPQLKEAAELLQLVSDFGNKHKKEETTFMGTIAKMAVFPVAIHQLNKRFIKHDKDGKMISGGSEDEKPEDKKSKDDADRDKLRKQAGDSPEVIKIKQEYLKEVEKAYNLPPGIGDSVWKQESQRGNPKYMLSNKGAVGDFGFMPDTFKAYKTRPDADIYNYRDQAEAFGNYMSTLIRERHGNLNEALGWYNAGTNYNGSQARKYISDVEGRMSPDAVAGNTTEIHINTVNLNAKSDDPKKFAGDFVDKINSYSNISAQANTGTH